MSIGAIFSESEISFRVNIATRFGFHCIDICISISLDCPVDIGTRTTQSNGLTDAFREKLDLPFEHKENKTCLHQCVCDCNVCLAMYR